MKSFYEFYQDMVNELGTPGINAGAPVPGQPPMQQQQQPGPQPGAQGTSPPVPPPDPNLMNGLKMLGQVKDPKVNGVFQNFMKQLQGLGINVPGAAPAAPAPSQQYNPAQRPNPGSTNPAQTQQQNPPAQ